MWENFQFLVRKLGFSHARLELEDGEEIWQANGISMEAALKKDHHREFHRKKGDDP